MGKQVASVVTNRPALRKLSERGYNKSGTRALTLQFQADSRSSAFIRGLGNGLSLSTSLLDGAHGGR